MTRLPRSKLAWISLAVFALTGCGGAGDGGSGVKKVVMQGDVTYNGRPVEDGTIAFTFVGGDLKGSALTASGPIKNGHYKLLDVIPGKNIVSIKGPAQERNVKGMPQMPDADG